METPTMTSRDWYRKGSWTTDDRKDFFAHLSRARHHNKAQYLRIQAVCLAEVGTKDTIKGALELLDLILEQYSEPVLLESVFSLKAECLEEFGQIDEAINSYRLAFQARRNKPNVRTNAPLRFGILAVRHNRTDIYDEVLAIQQELLTENDIIFPVLKYMYFAANAIIADEYNLHQEAREYAKIALRAASIEHSGFSRHPKLGLVEKVDKGLDRKLRKITNPSFLSMLGK